MSESDKKNNTTELLGGSIRGDIVGQKRPHKLPRLPTAGERMRAKAIGEGLPPMVALATQISTKIYKNIVSYRGSGPIPPGLYYSVMTGEAKPKPVTEKAKSSNYGPMEGRAVKDSKNGRFEKKADGSFAIRPDIPPSLLAKPLQMSLRDIYNDIGKKKI